MASTFLFVLLENSVVCTWTEGRNGRQLPDDTRGLWFILKSYQGGIIEIPEYIENPKASH